MTSFSQFEGPRRVRGEELMASEVLDRLCFGGPEITSEEEIPASYTPPKRGGVYVIAHEGRLVSQLGVTHDRIRVYDGSIRTASIGGVCTHPDYENKGLASYLLDACTRKLVQEGARLMLISGTRGLYTRLGNVLHGRYVYFSIKPGQSKRWRLTPTDLGVRRMTGADTLTASRLYQAEPVHYIRQNSAFAKALNDPAGNPYIHADQWMVERAGQAAAYLFLGSPWEAKPEAGLRYVSEYAGSRLAMVDAIQELTAASNLQEFIWPVPWQDFELIQMLQECGFDGSAAPLAGHTLRIVDFPGFMKDIHPILQARLGAELLHGLRFEQSGPLLGGSGTDRYTIRRDKDCLELDGAGMTRLVMGSVEDEPDTARLPGALAEVIPALFPVPSFLPGLNYR